MSESANLVWGKYYIMRGAIVRATGVHAVRVIATGTVIPDVLVSEIREGPWDRKKALERFPQYARKL
jgi:hypothetical protein